MKLFKHSSGIMVSFGFDVSSGREDRRMIAWNDPHINSWEASSTSLAGWNKFEVDIDPQFLIEREGAIFAYQPGLLIVMSLTEIPSCWKFSFLKPDVIQ